MDLHAQELVASAARTATGNSGPRAAKGFKLGVVIHVTAVSGSTPSLTPTIEWSHDGTNFGAAQPADSMTAITTAGTHAKQFDVKGRFFRLVWTISGTTPSFTFSAGEAHM